MRRVLLLLVAISIVFSCFFTGRANAISKWEVKLGKVEYVYEAKTELHFPSLTSKYLVWSEGKLWGGPSIIKSMDLQTKEVFTLTDKSSEGDFFLPAGFGTQILDEFYCSFSVKEGNLLTLGKLDGSFKANVSSEGANKTSYPIFLWGKLVFWQGFEDEEKNGIYTFDYLEWAKQDPEKIIEPVSLFKVKEGFHSLVSAGDYLVLGGFFVDSPKMINSKGELVKEIEKGYELMQTAGDRLMLCQKQKDKPIKWFCYNISDEKMWQFEYKTPGHYVFNCQNNSDEFFLTTIGENQGQNPRNRKYYVIAYHPDRKLTKILTEKINRADDFKSKWRSTAVFSERENNGVDLKLYDFESNKFYKLNEPGAYPYDPCINEGRVVWVDNYGFDYSIAMRTVELPEKKK